MEPVLSALPHVGRTEIHDSMRLQLSLRNAVLPARDGPILRKLVTYHFSPSKHL